TARNDSFLMPAFRDAWNQIFGFRRLYASAIPKPAADLIDSYQNIGVQTVFNKTPWTPSLLLDIVTMVCAARAWVDYLLRADEEPANRLVERAFVHRKRCIVADPDIAAKWQTAFDGTTAEVRCEALGAAHLLLHGIWAFKAHTAKE